MGITTNPPDRKIQIESCMATPLVDGQSLVRYVAESTECVDTVVVD